MAKSKAKSKSAIKVVSEAPPADTSVVRTTKTVAPQFFPITAPVVPASVEKAYKGLVDAIDASHLPISRKTKAKNDLRLRVKRSLKI